MSERALELSMGRLRRGLIANLFNLAVRVVGGETRHRRVGWRMVQITREEREAWLRIAEQTARTIEKISENIDEEEIKTRLMEIRELIIKISNTQKETDNINIKNSKGLNI